MKRVWIAFPILAACAVAAGNKVKLPNSRADLERGQKLFAVHCALCHGPKGEGGRGPTLAQVKLRLAPDDAALVRVIEDGVPGTDMPGADVLSGHEVRQTAAFVRSLGKVAVKAVPGNPAVGAEIFRGKGGCTTCHSIEGQGGVAGPDLTSIGASRSAPFLRETLLDPQKSVQEGYLLVTVVPKTGESVSGALVNEDSFSIQLRDSAGGSHSFWKAEVDRIERQKGKTPMPSYQGKLSEPELTNLISYLVSLKEMR